MGLRETKKDRTRAALVAAGERLFREQGFDGTTIAEIAAAAEVGTRTYFRYFATKHELLFADAERRIAAAREAIDSRGPRETPAAVLVRALHVAGLTRSDAPTDLDVLRLQLIREIPAVSGRAAVMQRRAEEEIGEALREAYPDVLDEISAEALVGAFIGAFSSATAAAERTMTDAAQRPAAIRRAVEHALRGGAADVGLSPSAAPTGRG